MSRWKCCRMCLGEQMLHPIFLKSEHHEKYTEVVFTSTGIKVEQNDSLPQEMCTICINFINDSYRFRKKCSESQKVLEDRLSEKITIEVKLETDLFNIETGTDVSIDISDFINDTTTFDENDSTNYNNDNEYEAQDLIENAADIILDSKSSKKIAKKPVRRKVKEKKTEKSGDKKERVKEKIECEYCHKILTSKLSLRNHYKIHTGFDVVCEHCGKKFITKRLLLMHCRAKHGYEKTDKCSYCDYRASNAEQVKIHERLHTGEKPYACAECGASFHRKSSYLQHVAIHLPDKTVQCDQCPARFKSVTLMRIHRSRHRAARYSFECRVCRRAFARRRNVARHLQRVHRLAPDAAHVLRTPLA